MRTPEEYFERDEDGIRLKGHRMWLENILDLYKEGMNAQQITETFSTLSLDEAQAAIDYYHRHTAEVDAYMEQQTREALEREREADEHPSPYALRMHALLEERMRERDKATKATQS
jgi:uncharacterized protein (DUF433 family)